MRVGYTRKQYMAGECDHRTYWRQFVTEEVRELVLRHIPREELMGSQDPHFNDIPLQRWDLVAAGVPQHVRRAIAESNATMQAPGTRGGVSPSDLACLLKEAARQIVEGAQRRTTRLRRMRRRRNSSLLRVWRALRWSARARRSTA